jgi:hypothetical protein
MTFNIKARVDFKTRKRARMSVWEAIELLNTLVDESDPDVSTLAWHPHPFDIFALDEYLSDRTSASNSRGHSERW